MIRMNIRNYIMKNFKKNTSEDIKNSIEESINEKEEVTLPGLGVFFEILWTNSNEKLKIEILEILEKSFN